MIFLTAKSQVSDRVSGLATGANDYLVKPIARGELLARVRVHLELHSLQRELASLVEAKTVQLRETLQDLKAKNSELEDFTYTVSHDLKSPLMTIMGFAGLLKRDVVSGRFERLEGNVTRIEEGAMKMSQLLKELLELSRIGRMMNPSEDVSMREVFQEAAEMVEGQARERGVQIEIAPDLPQVNGDRIRLLEVAQNLLSNAIKFMGDQATPRVEAGFQVDNDKQVFHVRDNGSGIEPQHQGKIFGLFDRLDSAVEGTGVGLALVKRIVEVHGGRVWVESEGAGLGTTFFFTLPAGEGD